MQNKNHKTLLILGNGFDLSCGLKSRYQDFYEAGIEGKISRSCSISNIDFEGDFEISFGTYEGHKFGFWERWLYENKENLKNPHWHDIENLIKETMLDINGFNGKIVDDLQNIFYRAFNYCAENCDEIPSPSSNSFLNYAQNLLKHNPDKFIYNYIVIYLLIVCEFEYANNSNIPKLLIKFNHHLFSQLNNLERLFNKYLKYKVENSINYETNVFELYCKLTNSDIKEFYKDKKINNIFENIETEYNKIVSEVYRIEENSDKINSIKIVDVLSRIQDLRDGKIIANRSNILSSKYPASLETIRGIFNVSILNFNYTFQSWQNKECKFGLCLNSKNVHGSLCLNGSDIIFGIDDSVISTNYSDKKDLSSHDEIRIFSKTFRTLNNFGTNSTKILPPKDTNVKIIFFGHSLNKADYSYFQSIFDYYDIYNNSNISLVFYYNSWRNGVRDEVSYKFEETDKVYKFIHDYGKTFNNKNQGENLIHKLQVENRIQILDVEFK